MLGPCCFSNSAKPPPRPRSGGKSPDRRQRALCFAPKPPGTAITWRRPCGLVSRFLDRQGYGRREWGNLVFLFRAVPLECP